MEEQILTLLVSSVQDLKEKLAKSLSEKAKPKFIALAIHSRDLLVQPFDLPQSNVKELKEYLENEARELLSLKNEDVEVDFQVFESLPDKNRGVFVCIAKKLLNQYLQVLDDINIIPIRITPHMLANIDAMFYLHKDQTNQRICLLDFTSKQKVNLAVFFNKRCEHLREIQYENEKEAKSDISQSLRCVCAKSNIKQCDHFYYVGEIKNLESIISELKKEFKSQVDKIEQIDVQRTLGSPGDYFIPNLMRNYTFSITRRKQLMMATNIVLGIFLLWGVFLSGKIINQGISLKKLKASYTVEKYQYALDLMKQMESL